MSSTVHKDAKTTTESVAHEHPDAAYIKRDDIGVVIAKGLAVMYRQKPKNPVDFLAKWLLNYAQVEKAVVAESEHKEKVKELKDKHQYQLGVQKKELEAQEEEAKTVEKKKEDFKEKLVQSSDLTDQLQDLANYLKEFTAATSVYIGKLVSPKKPIGDEDDDKAHIDEEA